MTISEEKAAEEAARPGWQATLELGFARRAQRTLLLQRQHCGPLRVQKAFYPEGPEVCQVIILHPPGGIAGGDRLAITVDAATGSQVLLTTPGAGKWYRSDGRTASQSLSLHVGAGATIEWLPQETIVFAGANASLQSRVELAAGAVFLGWEILCLGRTESGECFHRGRVNLSTRIERAGRPLWIERGRLVGGSPWLAAAAGFAGRPVSAMLCLAGRPVESEWLTACRELPVAEELLTGVTALPELLIARCLAPGVELAREWLVDVWQRLRPMALGREAVRPRIWST